MATAGAPPSAPTGDNPPPHSATNLPPLDSSGMTAHGVTAESLMLDKSKIPR
jgi:hypothetical protein